MTQSQSAYDQLPSRRTVIATAAATLVGGASVSTLLAADQEPKAKRLVRFAHLTDVHVQTDRAADRGFETALAHVQQQADPPEWIMFGGDNVMNVDGKAGAATADQQLKTWNRCLKNGLSIPYQICVGNHDVLNNDAVDGKKWAVDSYGLSHPFYRFDRNGWRFIVLDSTMPSESGYKARLDEAQFDWLRKELQDTESQIPIAIVSHIPILSASTFFDGENEKSGNWVVPGAWMHLDARTLKDLFLKHTNVKLSLSGHIHLVDEVRYNTMVYYCNGAVSGGWWKGPFQEFGNGYALIDLFDDGTVQRTFVNFPWQAQP
jgi:3',5'-cyclic AMP phosphodiesterase CpdA